MQTIHASSRRAKPPCSAPRRRAGWPPATLLAATGRECFISLAQRVVLLALVLELALAPAAGCDPSTSGAPPGETGFPAPVVAGTAESDAVADAPARCGQPAHRWLRDGVGVVVAHGEVTSRTASLIEGLAATAGLPLPAAPSFDTSATVLKYQTQDRGSPIEATASVAWPVDLFEEEREMPVLLVLHGTQGFTDGCSVDRSPGGLLLAQYLASLGFFVVAPDYIGLKASGEPTGFLHPYLVGQATAIASLDAVRAAVRLGEDVVGKVLPRPEVLVFGGSQGGHAALWVERLAPYYARELELLGVVATTPPADLLAHSQRALTSLVNATANTVAMIATSSGWYEADIGAALRSPYDESVPAALAASCEPDDAAFEAATLADLFQPALLDAAAAGTLDALEPFGCIFAENGLVTTSIAPLTSGASGASGASRASGASGASGRATSSSFGMLMVMGESDGLVHTPIERDAFAELCEAGAPMRYLECAGAEHVDATVWALPEVVEFILARRAREPFAADCAVTPPTTCRGTPAE